MKLFFERFVCKRAPHVLRVFRVADSVCEPMQKSASCFEGQNLVLVVLVNVVTCFAEKKRSEINGERQLFGGGSASYVVVLYTNPWLSE